MKNKYLSTKKIIIFTTVLALVIAGGTYYRHQQIALAKAAEAKLDAENKAIGDNIREGARQLAEQMRLHPIKMQEDPFAEPEPSDAEEIAQAKLWHKTPPAQRAKIFSNQTGQ